jgi:predicted alpha-1,6-mannanase (GH76 family)
MYARAITADLVATSCAPHGVAVNAGGEDGGLFAGILAQVANYFF